MKIVHKVLVGFYVGLLFSAFSLAQTPNDQEVTSYDVDDTMSGWKPVCVLPTCNPGGENRPTKVSQTINHSSPSKDGHAMEFLLAGYKYTNALWTYRAGADDSATSFEYDVLGLPHGLRFVGGFIRVRSI